MALRRLISFLLLLMAAGLAVWLATPQAAWGAVVPAEAGQDATGYPAEGEIGYPVVETTPAYAAPDELTVETPTLTPSANPDQATPGAGTASPTPGGSPTFTLNPLTPSATYAPNLFGTEDAEMGRSLVTPPPSETPLPTATPTLTVTPSPTPSGLDRFHFNRSSFVLGLFMPLGLALVGWLGYRWLRSGEFEDG